MTAPEYLTIDEIRNRLAIRRKGRKLAEFHAEVERLSGMRLSKSHLANILSGEKNPNEVVMAYLGGGVEEKRKVYWLGGSAKRKAKR